MSNLNTNVFIELISNDGFVATSKHLIRKLGLLEAILIGELCSEHKYWANKRTDFDGWFASTISNIEENCGISRKLQEKTIKNLTKQGIIEMKNMGLPAKRHFKIITDSLYKLFDSNGHNSNADNEEICNSLNTSLPNHETTKNEENTQNTHHNTSSNKIVTMGQTRLHHRDKLDCPNGTNSNNNINNNTQNNIYKNNSPAPKSTMVDAVSSTDTAQKTEDEEIFSNDKDMANIPKYEDIIAYSKTYGDSLIIDPNWFYEYNNRRKWQDKTGNKIRSWKALFNNWNCIKAKQLNDERTHKAEIKQKALAKAKQQETEQRKFEQERAAELTPLSQMTCPKCGRTFPDENISFSVYDSTLNCKHCNISWAFFTNESHKFKASVVV